MYKKQTLLTCGPGEIRSNTANASALEPFAVNPIALHCWYKMLFGTYGNGKSTAPILSIVNAFCVKPLGCQVKSSSAGMVSALSSMGNVDTKAAACFSRFWENTGRQMQSWDGRAVGEVEVGSRTRWFSSRVHA